MPPTRTQFADRLTDSGIMSLEDLAEFEAELPADVGPEDAEPLARALVDSGRLTPFQAEALLGDTPTPLRLGNYLLLDRVGSGGMGHVHKAIHERMNRVVAVKILPPLAAMDEGLVARFRREVQVAAQLHHPHIVTAYDADEADGLLFLVMEYVEAPDLAAVIEERGPLPVDEALACIEQAAEALQYAHGRGVLHRDVKPANLLLQADGHVKVLDMGLARLESSEGLTTTGEVIGTVTTMAPEQGDEVHLVDERSDVYALGCTLFFLLTGRHVYAGDSPLQVLLSHARAPIPSLRELRPEVPASVAALFESMVQKRREDRVQDMGAVLAAIAAIRADRAPELPPPAPATPEPSTRRGGWRRIAAVLLLAALGVAAWIATRDDPGPAPPAGPAILAPARVLRGHLGTVHAVTPTPDGRRILSASGDDTVGIWSLERGEMVGRLEGHEDAVRCVLCLRDGETVITSSDDATIRIWDLGTRKTRRVLRGHEDKVRHIAVAPDETWLASVGKDGSLRIWDLPSGDARLERTEHGDWDGENVGLMAVSIHPDGTRLATVGFDEMLRVWSAPGFAVTRALGPLGADPGVVAYSPDGRFLAHDFDAGPVRVLDADATTELHRLAGHDDWVYSIAWAPDRPLLATGSQDRTIRLWNAERGTPVAVLEGHEYTVGALAFSPDGGTLFSGAGDDAVIVWDVGGVLPRD